MRSNKILQTILIVLVSLIWIAVFYRTFSLLKTDKQDSQELLQTINMNEQKEIKNRLQSLNLSLNKKSIHDPFGTFSYKRKVSSYKKTVTSHKKEKNITPAYLLKGIVWDHSNPQAILIKSKLYVQDEKTGIGETIIVKPDDTIEHGKVLEISENYVIISTYNHKFKLWSNLWKKVD